MRSLFFIFFAIALVFSSVFAADAEEERREHPTGRPDFSGKPPMGAFSHGTGFPHHHMTTPPTGK